MKKILNTLFLTGLLISGTAAVHADTLIDVNFTNGSALYSGAAAIGSSGDTWNNINSPGSGNFTTSSSNNNSYNGSVTARPTSLVDSTGAATGATLTTAGFLTATGPYGSEGDFATNLFTNSIAAYGGANPTSASLSFANLAHDTTYELELYTSNFPGGGLNRSLTFTANGGSATALDQVSSASFDNGQNYVSIEGTTDGFGNLVITATSASSNNSNGSYYQGGFIEITGVQVLALPATVPEPSTCSMMVAGLFLLLGVQRLRLTRQS